jgi:hypothetical protein
MLRRSLKQVRFAAAARLPLLVCLDVVWIRG